ncbi:hypothetical protein PT974_01175 [Cladobotryum mycophilum]|uniref:Uncharacterized protein n=1 Tax=Cladobotryum mycophilum TaxID=491253 RepID=A0ABR0T3V2_9HYPO
MANGTQQIKEETNNTSNAHRPGSVLLFFDLADCRVLKFWLIELAGAASFVFWLGVTSYLPQLHHISASTIIESRIDDVHSSSALGLIAAIDAFAVVFSFNRILIDRFHYAVSLRMMLLASTISFGVWLWNKDGTNIVSQHPVGCLLLGSSFYMSIPPQWSSIIPVVHVGFEAIFLSMMKAARTSRYIVLSSAVLQATICAHWGMAPLAKALLLTISPLAFLGLMLSGRLLLDIHLGTMFRSSPELQWARKRSLISTHKLVIICAGMLVLEKIGLRVVTYVRLIVVPLFFGLSSAGFLAPAAYVVSFGKIKMVRV